MAKSSAAVVVCSVSLTVPVGPLCMCVPHYLEDNRSVPTKTFLVAGVSVDVAFPVLLLHHHGFRGHHFHLQRHWMIWRCVPTVQ